MFVFKGVIIMKAILVFIIIALAIAVLLGWLFSGSNDHWDQMFSEEEETGK